MRDETDGPLRQSTLSGGGRGARRFFLLPLVLLAFAAAPAAGELVPRPEEVTLPEERPVMEAAFAHVEGPDLYAQRMVKLDAALLKLDRPTRLRGLIQFGRALGLRRPEDIAAAREAIDESIRLLPGYSGPLLIASNIYAYSDMPGRGAEYLIRASEIDPDIVKTVPEHDVRNIFHRLGAQRDQRRMRSLSERLMEIGWLGDGLASRSSIARRVIEARMADGDVACARALVPKLLNPEDSRALLIQNRYSALWPDIERWGGPMLGDQWRLFLGETRASWEAGRDPAQTLAYVRALSTAGRDDVLLRDVLPLLSKPLRYEDADLIFAIPPLAGALGRAGRWGEIEALFERADKVWPFGSSATALNLAANRARYSFYAGRAEEGVARMDKAIADAARWKEEVNADALASMHNHRTCMLHALGKVGPSATMSAHPLGQGPASMVHLNLCLGKVEGARDLLIARLADEDSRADVLDIVQKDDQPPMAGAYGETMRARYEALRSDPKLLEAVARHGRALPYSLQAGAAEPKAQAQP